MNQNIGTTYSHVCFYGCMLTIEGGPFINNLFLISKEFLFHASCSRLTFMWWIYLILLSIYIALYVLLGGPFFTLINQEWLSTFINNQCLHVLLRHSRTLQSPFCSFWSPLMYVDIIDSIRLILIISGTD